MPSCISSSWGVSSMLNSQTYPATAGQADRQAAERVAHMLID